MHILVTGGAGFIGSHLVDRLVKDGHEVTVIDDLSTGKSSNLPKGVRLWVEDIRHPSLSGSVHMARPDVVFHLAAQINLRESITDPIRDAYTNIIGTINLIKACVEVGTVKKFVFASTGGAIYGDVPRTLTPHEGFSIKPESPYAIAKAAAEMYILNIPRIYMRPYWTKETNIGRMFGMKETDMILHNASRAEIMPDISILRLANVYGPRQDPKGEAGVVAIFLDKMLKGETVTIFGDGTQTRDFIHVYDVVEAMVRAMDVTAPFHIINIGTGVETSIVELFHLMADMMGYDRSPVFEDAIPGELRRSVLDVTVMKNALGVRPMNLRNGLNRMI